MRCIHAAEIGYDRAYCAYRLFHRTASLKVTRDTRWRDVYRGLGKHVSLRCTSDPLGFSNHHPDFHLDIMIRSSDLPSVALPVRASKGAFIAPLRTPSGQRTPASYPTERRIEIKLFAMWTLPRDVPPAQHTAERRVRERHQ